MLDKNILKEIDELKLKRQSIIDNLNLINREINNLIEKLQESCNHKDELGNPTIEYDSIYEMRSSDMNCMQCNKSGSRKELTVNK